MWVDGPTVYVMCVCNSSKSSLYIANMSVHQKVLSFPVSDEAIIKHLRSCYEYEPTAFNPAVRSTNERTKSFQISPATNILYLDFSGLATVGT